jgi:hypothetical protein
MLLLFVLYKARYAQPTVNPPSLREEERLIEDEDNRTLVSGFIWRLCIPFSTQLIARSFRS